MLTFLALDIPSYDLPGLSVKIPHKGHQSNIVGKDSGPMYGDLEQTLIYMLENQVTNFTILKRVSVGTETLLSA